MRAAEAQEWLTDTLSVSRETLSRFCGFVSLLAQENSTQNLVSNAENGEVWHRHIVDSAQLLRLAPVEGAWIDLGTGAGFPGLIVGTLRRDQTVLVEQRKLRADFLLRSIEVLDAGDRITVWRGRAESMAAKPFSVISARAFAPLGRLLEIGARFAAPDTRWILPKGRTARAELEAVRSSWQGEFRVEPSVTDPEAGIIVAEGVRRRAGKGRQA